MKAKAFLNVAAAAARAWQVSNRRRPITMTRVLGVMVSLVLTGMAANASATTFFNGFEGIGPFTSTIPAGTGGCDTPTCTTYPFNTDYSEGGITVRDVSTGGSSLDSAVFLNLANLWGGVGNFNWYTATAGYTDITLTDGAAFQTIQFLEGSGHSSGPNVLAYQLLSQGVVVATGILPDDTTDSGTGYQLIEFSGGGFDEVRIQGNRGLTAFDITSPNIMAIDSITAVGVPAPIAGAGLPGVLFAGGGLLVWCRSRRRTENRRSLAS
jgi:hypothetical protein